MHCLIWLAGLARNWLPNLCLAGNPVTRIPDFVQPWWYAGWKGGDDRRDCNVENEVVGQSCGDEAEMTAQPGGARNGPRGAVVCRMGGGDDREMMLRRLKFWARIVEM